VQISDHFRAILGCLLEAAWTTPRLVDMVITPNGRRECKSDRDQAFHHVVGNGGVGGGRGFDFRTLFVNRAGIRERIKKRLWQPWVFSGPNA
jgi:hypothetical protein